MKLLLCLSSAKFIELRTTKSRYSGSLLPEHYDAFILLPLELLNASESKFGGEWMKK